MVIAAKLIGTDGTKHEEEGFRVIFERSYYRTMLSALISLLRPWLFAETEDGWNSTTPALGTNIEVGLSD